MLQKGITALLLFMSIIGYSQYKITGQIDNLADGTKVHLMKMDYGLLIELSTSLVKNGQFEFVGKLPDTMMTMVQIRVDDKEFRGSAIIWLDENSQVTIEGHSRYLLLWAISNHNAYQTLQNEYSHSCSTLYGAVDSIMQYRVRHMSNDVIKAHTRKQLDSLYLLRASCELDVIKKEPNHVISLEKLNHISKWHPTMIARIKEISDRLTPEYQKHIYNRGVKTNITTWPETNVGDDIIDVSLHDLNGTEYKLSDFSDKYTLVDFWFNGCRGCMIAMPCMREIHEKYKDQLNIISINIDNKRSRWAEASQKENFPWFNLADGNGQIGGVNRKYAVIGYPTYLLISPEGKIVERFMSGLDENFAQLIEPHLDNKR